MVALAGRQRRLLEEPLGIEQLSSVNSGAPTAADGRRALHIAMVVPPYFEIPPRAYGGVESVVADLTHALIGSGHRVSLIGVDGSGTGAETVPLWPRLIPERLGEPFPEVAHAALARRAVRRLAREQGVDLVHDHTLAGPLNAPAYAALGLPTVVTAHGPVDDDLRRLYGALGTDIELVAISDRQRELAPELNWAGRVHNAVRVASFPFRAEKEDYALFLGRFHPQKAPHLALDAAHAAGLPLILAGKCSEPLEKEYFAREVEPRLTQADRVFGVADAQAKRKLLAGARCLLFPVQWEEPFGMVMIEAMACGTPVVALRGGAVPEVVADGVTGYIADDPAELPELLGRLHRLDAAACRRRVAALFDVDRLGAGYTAVYRHVLERRAVAAKAQPTDLEQLRRDYGDLDAALDRYQRDHRRSGRSGRPGLSRHAGRPAAESSESAGAA
jgi:glycosyltransferase involved in cell wall biosynthesis